MITFNVSKVQEELAFAETAAKAFAEHPEWITFTKGEIEPGCFFAVRWGLGKDCVVVLKLDATHEPTNYVEVIGKYRKSQEVL